jgi:NADPH:quinone reductase
MKAAVVPNFGGPEVFQVRDVPEPVPGPGQVAIRVRYAGVNFTDVRNRIGDGLGEPPFTPGVEASGTVVAVGPGVAGFEVGQHVAAVTGGSAYAEVVLAPAPFTIPIDDVFAADPASGATLAVVTTAIVLLRHGGRVQPDESLLFHAAAGGLGSVLPQVAHALGLHGAMYGTVGSADKVAYAKKCGYDAVLLRDDFESELTEPTSGRGVDVVFDSIGGDVRRRSFQVLAPLGRLVHFSNASGEPEMVPDAAWLRVKSLGYIGVGTVPLLRSAPDLVQPALSEAIELVASGRVTVDVTGTFPLAEVSEAHRRFADRAVLGKLVLIP